MIALVSLALTAFPVPDSKKWAPIEKLINEQKYEAASAEVAKLREKAKERKDDAEWARTIIKEVQLRLGLHGFETSVRFMREEKWPDSALPRTVLNLYYGYNLLTYIQSYGWEIAKREKVEAKGLIDLKQWNREQIFLEALRAYDDAWKQREALGAMKRNELEEFIAQGNYPEHIRTSLRDTLTYLAIGLIENTANWRPDESNDIYRLDLKALLQGNVLKMTALADGETHPVIKVCALLDDLEAWHRKNGREEAALETRLARYRFLARTFPGAADKKAVQAHLRETLKPLRKLPWWAEGMAVLAEMVRDNDKDLVEARAIAAEGEKAFPNEIGGGHCKSIRFAIEAPAYTLSGMQNDGLGKRSIQVTHKNFPTLYFRAYHRDLIKQIEAARNYNLLPDYQQIQNLVKIAPVVANWSVDLPATPDFESHTTYVTPPLHKVGLYVIVASAKPDFSENDNRLVGVNFIATEMVPLSRNQNGQLEINVLNGNSGKPVAGAKVILYRYDYDKGHKRVLDETTNADGVAIVKQPKTSSYNSYFFIVKHDDDVTIDPQYISFYAGGGGNYRSSSFVYTDRAIYRPMQKIQWKVVSYSGQDGDFKVNAGGSGCVQLFDPNHQQVQQQSVTFNEFGSAAGSFEVPTGRLLGMWSMRTCDGGWSNVRVEEYKRPTFEVELKPAEGAVRLNKQATLKGQAKYFFGLPVTNGNVKWTLKREPVYPYWWWWYYWYAPPMSAQTIASGGSKLQADGTFEIKVTPEADEREGKDITYRYSLHADLTDEGGETRSADRAFHLGFVAVKADIGMANQFFLDRDDAELTVTRSNLDGDPRPGPGKFKIVELAQPAEAVVPSELPLPNKKAITPGDKQRSRQSPSYNPDQTMALWADGREVKSGALASGDSKIQVGKLAPGAYRLRYETSDEFGAKYETFKNFIVAGKKTPLKLPGLFLAQSTNVTVGGTARFLVASGLKDQRITLERFKAVERQSVQYLNSDTVELIEVPIGEKDRGGFGMTFTAVRDYQPMAFTQTVFVPWDNKELELGFESFRDLLRPGSKETWRVKVKAKTARKAEARTAEVLAYMFDKSLDLFGPHTPPSPLSVYPSYMSAQLWHPTLATLHEAASFGYWYSNPGYYSLSGESLRFYNSYGIGGLGARFAGGLGGGNMRARRMAEEPMAAPSAPAPAALADSREMERDDAPKAEAKAKKSADRGEASLEQQANVAPAQPSAAQPAVEMRSNFSETAFFAPQLVTDDKGEVAIEFTVPDSVTAYHVWVHAVTKDLRAGSLSKDTRAVKELMVRPYMPRFLRESDQGELKVVVNNAGAKPLNGRVSIAIFDPETNRDLTKDFGISTTSQVFSVKPDGGSNVGFAFTAPKRVGQVAFKVIAQANDLSDGELRPLPVLPSRMHLAQSRFVTLRDKASRTMVFDDLKNNDDPTRIDEQMVVTIDAQLFYTVLKALPYLISYPYECLEQTLNRFMSAGIVSSIYRDFPQIAAMADKMSARTTQLEKFDAPDPNRKMTLEESPWLQEAKGGADEEGLINVLNPKIARANRESALAKIRKAQFGNGAWPWFAGGPASPWITMYMLYGFAKAAEFKVDVPKDMVQRAWSYVASYVRNDVFAMMYKYDCCWETVTFINYILTMYPDASWHNDVFSADERKKMLDFSFSHWKRHSPMSKAQLALALHRMNRHADAVKVFESVMDSAKTAQDQGTFWAPEDRSWLWYNDTIETHAIALRTLTELMPKDPKRDGLVLWLLLNKKLNHWKSTRATAEVIYSLAHYMKADKSLGVREEALVTAGPEQHKFTFEPTEYQGKAQVVLKQAVPEVTVSKETKGFMFASTTWHFSTDKLPAEDRGDFFRVSRTYYKREHNGREYTLKPLSEGAALKAGDELEVQISLRTKHEAEYVHLRDPRAAGYEPENQVSRWRWDMGIGWYEEIRDSGTNFFFEKLPVGEYTFKYRVRAAMAGKFRVGPAQVQSMYAPEFVAYSAGHVLTITP